MANAFKVLIVLALAFTGVAFLLPSTRHIEREIDIGAPVSAIERTLLDMRTWPEWTAWTAERDPESQMTFSDPPTGQGAWWRWTEGKEYGAGEFSVVNSSPGETVYLMMSYDGLADSPTRFDLTRSESGTRVVWVQELVLGNRPDKRWIGMLADKALGADMAEGLEGLKLRCETQ